MGLMEMLVPDQLPQRRLYSFSTEVSAKEFLLRDLTVNFSFCLTKIFYDQCNLFWFLRKSYLYVTFPTVSTWPGNCHK